MDGSAVNAITTLAQQAAGENTVLETPDGKIYSTVGLHLIPRDEKPDQPATLGINSLQGLVDYIAANRDKLTGAECFVHVLSPTTVRVVSGLQARAVRHTYIEATAADLFSALDGKALSLLEANIALQARVVAGFDREKVLALLGNVKDEGELRVEDDGTTQTVKTRGGVVLADEAKVPNPVTLSPFRTFREVDQPESPFILRMHKGHGEPQASLHQADGGAWQLVAVERVAAWLTGKVGDFAVIR